LLTGTLDDFSLPEIFRLIASAARSGCIDVTRSAGTGTVFFKDGEVYYAESSLTHEPAGGEGADREAALRSQIEAAVFDLLRWDEGSFKWESGSTFESDTGLTLSIEDLVEEALRRLEELEVISTKIPSEAAILALAAAPPDGAAEINITPEEWRVLVHVNGLRDVTEIARIAGMDTFSVMWVLYGLCDHELIAVAETGREPADPGSSPTEDAAPEGSEAGEPGEASEELEVTEKPQRTASPEATESEAEFAPVLDEPSSDVTPEAVEATLPEPSVDRTAAVRELAGLFDHADR
jgi:hypothetical protein